MNNSYSDSYGVFCMAMLMDKHNTKELDVWWDEAIKLYKEFINSEFNNSNQSELDCINQFITSRAK